MAFEDWFIAHARVSSKPHRKVSLDDKMTFFHQLSTLVSSGTPLLQAMQICAEQSQSIKLRQVLEQIAARVAAGSSRARRRRQLSRTSSSTIGSKSSAPAKSPGKCRWCCWNSTSKSSETRATHRKINGAMMYPIILICFAIGAVTAMLWFVIPTFAKMFKDLGAELPGITQFVVDLSGLRRPLRPLRPARHRRRGRGRSAVRARPTPAGACFIGVGVALPLVGELIVQSAMYRFASNIALLLKSGIPMLETLAVLEGVFHTSPIYRDALARVQTRVAAGRPLAASLEETGLFTTMITNMVRIGEESGQLPRSWSKSPPITRKKWKP